MRTSTAKHRLRIGFTLIELILVMGIVALVAGFALPAVFRVLGHQKLDKAADLVRTEMGRARVQAIRTGQIHALVYSVGDNRLAVESFQSVIAKQSSGPRLGAENDQRSSDLDYTRERLPRDVLFVGGQSRMDARSAFELAQGGQASSNWTLILFYPDGTSQDAKVFLANRDGFIAMVALRGLTGSTRVVRGLEAVP